MEKTITVALILIATYFVYATYTAMHTLNSF